MSSCPAEEIGVWGKGEGADFETPVSGDDWVVPVPEAPTLPLLATGMFALLGLAGLRRRRALARVH